MKKILMAIIGILFTITIVEAQNDTLFIYKAGNVIYKEAVAQIDSMIFEPGSVSGGTVTDYDGNVYNTVVIGTKVWTVENLKVTHYRNGDPIPNIIAGATWVGLTTGAYVWYDNDISNKDTYGALYNWYAVVDTRNIAPEGWHVPTNTEMMILSEYLGGDIASGGKMKEIGTTHWMDPNVDATNESGFTGLPSGMRYGDGVFYDINTFAYIWSSTQQDASFAYYKNLYYLSGSSNTGVADTKKAGFCVRLVKD
jgi:uncharacterized protein (TIGR02145 family)